MRGDDRLARRWPRRRALLSGWCFGSNGAGMTTLIRIVTRLSDLDSGTAFADVSCGVYDLRGVHQRCGSSGQLTVADAVVMGSENRGEVARLSIPSRHYARSGAEVFLELFGLASFGDRVETCSGGLRRRLNLVCILVARLSVLSRCEPPTGLDPLVGPCCGAWFASSPSRVQQRSLRWSPSKRSTQSLIGWRCLVARWSRGIAPTSDAWTAHIVSTSPSSRWSAMTVGPLVSTILSGPSVYQVSVVFNALGLAIDPKCNAVYRYYALAVSRLSLVAAGCTWDVAINGASAIAMTLAGPAIGRATGAVVTGRLATFFGHAMIWVGSVLELITSLFRTAQVLVTTITFVLFIPLAFISSLMASARERVFANRNRLNFLGLSLRECLGKPISVGALGPEAWIKASTVRQRYSNVNFPAMPMSAILLTIVPFLHRRGGRV